MPELKEEKKALRAIYKEKRAQLPQDKKALLDGVICRNVISLECFDKADILLTFSPSFLEPNIDPIALEALRLNKRVAFPVCDKDTHTMTFRFVSSLDELREGSYSIPEPPCGNDEYRKEENAVCIVPALTFDREGYRLGYGGGYYDRFLEGFGGTSVGIVYEEFIIDKLPRQVFDKKTDIIISERGTILTNASKD